MADASSTSVGDNTKGSARPNPARAISRRRLWAFRLLSITVLPLIVLGLIEAGLRIAGVGYGTAFFVSAPGRDGFVMPNPKFGYRYFPAAIARRPEAMVMPARKEPGTLRVFVLGSSAAQGFPEPAFGLSRMIEVMLREMHPGAKIEVINTAMVAINSHVVVEIARQCAEYEPDFFVVYEGNNEIIGPWGPGTVFAGFTPSRGTIRFAQFLQRFRLAQVIARARTSVVGGGGGGAADATAWLGMEQFLKSTVPSGDPRLPGVEGHFEANLRDVVEAGRGAGARVILCTVGVNLRDCPPFASVHDAKVSEADRRRSEEWAGEAWEAAKPPSPDAAPRPDPAVRASALRRALQQVDEAIALAPTFAQHHFTRGRVLEALLQFDDSRAAYARARDLDALRFRTSSTLNEVVRRVAGVEGEAGAGGTAGVTLVDVEEAMSPAGSTQPAPGYDLFLEHCHLSFAGTHLVAARVVEAMLPVLPAEVKAKQARESIPDESECAAWLGYSSVQAGNVASSIALLVERPPFTFQAGHDADLARARREVDRLRHMSTTDAVRAALTNLEAQTSHYPGDWTLHRLYANLAGLSGQIDVAERETRSVIDLLPFDPDAGHTLAGILLQRVGAEAAIEQYERNLDSPWTNARSRAETYFSMGVAEERRGKPESAAARYEACLELEPRNVKALGNLGLLRLKEKKYTDAAALLDRALEAAPTSAQARLNRALVHLAQGQGEGAVKVLRAGVEAVPEDASLRVALGDVLAGLRRTSDALVEYSEAVRVAPRSVEARMRLGNALLSAGRAIEAQHEFEEVLKIAPDRRDAKEALERARAAQATGG